MEAHTRPSVGAASLPVLVPILRSESMFGIRSREIYRIAAAGGIALRKIGRSTYIETASMLRYIEALPAASLRTAA
jgi:hypothetical protein